MTTAQEPSRLDRRTFIQGAVGTALALPLVGGLASCAGGTGNSPAGGGQVSTTNPFGLADNSKIDAVIFNGGYATDYVDYAGAIVSKNHTGVAMTVTPITQIAQQLQPRFVGGNPPDLVDNSGANLIGFNTIKDQLESLDDVLSANNLEGTKILDTLYPGVQQVGTYNGKFVSLNYVMTVWGLWYSKSLFDANGWTPPTTWDEVKALGAKASAAGKQLFVWGKEAATYYLTLAIDSAIKEGGDSVRLALGNLKPQCWSLPEVQGVFSAIGDCVKAGYFIPGGAGTQFTQAQAKWSNDQQAILYPSGGWIENEMKKATKAGFQMTAVPAPVLSGSSKLPKTALHAQAYEGFIVPSQGKNRAGGKEVLRTMLSKDAATNFSKTRLAPTIVKGLIPTDGFGSTALMAQSAMLQAAGSNLYSYQFIDTYGMNTDQLVVWNSFLSGQTDVAGLTKGLQDITDKIANDSSITKVPVS